MTVKYTVRRMDFLVIRLAAWCAPSATRPLQSPVHSTTRLSAAPLLFLGTYSKAMSLNGDCLGLRHRLLGHPIREGTLTTTAHEPQSVVEAFHTPCGGVAERISLEVFPFEPRSAP